MPGISCLIKHTTCVCVCVCVCARMHTCTKSLQSCQTLGNPLNHSCPGSSVHKILWARILEWVVMPSSRGSSPTRDGNPVSHISYLLHWFFTTTATWEAQNTQHLLPKKKKGNYWIWIIWFRFRIILNQTSWSNFQHEEKRREQKAC